MRKLLRRVSAYAQRVWGFVKRCFKKIKVAIFGEVIEIHPEPPHSDTVKKDYNSPSIFSFEPTVKVEEPEEDNEDMEPHYIPEENRIGMVQDPLPIFANYEDEDEPKGQILNENGEWVPNYTHEDIMEVDDVDFHLLEISPDVKIEDLVFIYDELLFKRDEDGSILEETDEYYTYLLRDKDEEGDVYGGVELFYYNSKDKLAGKVIVIE